MLCTPDFAMGVCLKLVIRTLKTISWECATIKEQAGTNLLADVPQWKHLSSRSCSQSLVQTQEFVSAVIFQGAEIAVKLNYLDLSKQ